MGNVLVTKQVAMALFEAKNRIDVSPRARCVVRRQSSSPGGQRGDLLAPWSSPVGTGCTETIFLGVKRVAVAPFELKISANEPYGRAASVKPPPGAKRPRFEPKL